jgi:hypothetical protein
MNTATPDVQHVFEGLLRRRTLGDLEHAPCDNGLTFLQGVANDLFRDPMYAQRTMWEFDYRPTIQATLRKADNMNLRKRAILDALTPDAEGLAHGWKHFRRDYPCTIEKIDPVRFGPWAYVPLNQDRDLLGDGEEHPSSAIEWDAWYFRSDPFGIEGAW